MKGFVVTSQQTVGLLQKRHAGHLRTVQCTADDDFFQRVKTNSNHVLQPYLPQHTVTPYQLRTRPHNITLINKTKFLNDTDFIIHMLYKFS